MEKILSEEQMSYIQNLVDNIVDITLKELKMEIKIILELMLASQQLTNVYNVHYFFQNIPLYQHHVIQTMLN